ncbi:MAG: right-handed parallel beta-helix repeat-containing protein, partial [Chloroflexi bacterium]|nr:right-handed parallel beta-helix repeat-containing protein [Chloroflexota bacterium]
MKGANAQLTLNNLTISGGYTSGEDVGPAILVDEDATLVLDHVLITNNTAHHTGDVRPLDGVIIAWSGVLKMNQSAIRANSAPSDSALTLSNVDAEIVNSDIADNDAAGIDIWRGRTSIKGGAIRNNAQTGVFALYAAMDMDGVRISENRKFGIEVRATTLTMSNSQVVDNIIEKQAFGPQAGGMAISFNSVVTLTQTSVIGNRNYEEPGVEILGYDGIFAIDSTLTLIRSLVADDLSADNDDYAMAVNDGVLTVDNSTVSGSNRKVLWLGGAADAVILDSTILSTDPDAFAALNNTTWGEVRVGRSIVQSCWDPFTSLGYNLSAERGCFKRSREGDVLDPNLSAYLGPLQNNGGPTPTHALLAGPAIDAIPPHDEGCRPGQSLDQRGFIRAGGEGKGGAACDMGAYEA